MTVSTTMTMRKGKGILEGNNDESIRDI